MTLTGYSSELWTRRRRMKSLPRQNSTKQDVPPSWYWLLTLAPFPWSGYSPLILRSSSVLIAVTEGAQFCDLHLYLGLQTLFKTLKAVSHKTKKEHLSRYQISSNAKKPKDNCTNNHESTVPRIAKSTKDQDKLVLSDLYFSLFFSVNINICYSPREVRIEKNCARGLAYRPKR